MQADHSLKLDGKPVDLLCQNAPGGCRWLLHLQNEETKQNSLLSIDSNMTGIQQRTDLPAGIEKICFSQRRKCKSADS